jgi:hypothetical protein
MVKSFFVDGDEFGARVLLREHDEFIVARVANGTDWKANGLNQWQPRATPWVSGQKQSKP